MEEDKLRENSGSTTAWWWSSWFSDRASLRSTVEEEELEGEGCARGKGSAPMHLPTIYRGEGGWFLALQVHWGVGKGGWKEIPSFPFRTDCYPPFLGILILSLRDMILFLLRWDLGEP